MVFRGSGKRRTGKKRGTEKRKERKIGGASDSDRADESQLSYEAHLFCGHYIAASR